MSKTRELMNKSASYLAFGNEGRRGLDPVKVEACLYHINNWKKWFVMYVSDKPLDENGYSLLGMVMEFGPQPKMGRALASKLADKLFTLYYEGEVRAWESAPMGKYWERSELGAPEYMDWQMSDKVGKDSRLEGEARETIDYSKKLGVAKWYTTNKKKSTNRTELVRLMIRYPDKKNLILRNASNMAKQKMITKEDLVLLSDISEDVTRLAMA